MHGYVYITTTIEYMSSRCTRIYYFITYIMHIRHYYIWVVCINIFSHVNTRRWCFCKFAETCKFVLHFGVHCCNTKLWQKNTEMHQYHRMYILILYLQRYWYHEYGTYILSPLILVLQYLNIFQFELNSNSIYPWYR